jgi:hypothetical protein
VIRLFVSLKKHFTPFAIPPSPDSHTRHQRSQYRDVGMRPASS